MFTDVTCNPEIMKNASEAYFSLLQGMVMLQQIDLFFPLSLLEFSYSIRFIFCTVTEFTCPGTVAFLCVVEMKARQP